MHDNLQKPMTVIAGLEYYTRYGGFGSRHLGLPRHQAVVRPDDW
jgi:hypothetical protein